MSLRMRVSGRIGRFQMLSHFVSGTTSELHVAKDATRAGSDLVAFKVFNEASPGLADRLREELTGLMSLQHPGIARIHEVLDHEDHPCVVYDFVRGESLTQVLRAETNVSPMF